MAKKKKKEKAPTTNQESDQLVGALLKVPPKSAKDKKQEPKK